MWLTYGEGISSGQQGAIFSDVKWVDEFPNEVDMSHFGLDFGFTCLSGDTLITTINGEIPMVDIKVGDYVLTRHGYKKVLKKHDNGIKQVSEKKLDFDFGYRKIICTFDHKFKTKKQWKQSKELTEKDELCIIASSMEKSMLGDRTPSTQTTFIQRLQKRYCTEKYGKAFMEKYQKTCLFIISTIIRKTTQLETLCSLQIGNIQKSTIILQNLQQRWEMRKIAIQKKIGVTGGKRSSIHLKMRLDYVGVVGLNIRQRIRIKNIALVNATINTNILLLNLMRRICAKCVDILSNATNILNKKLAQANVLTNYRELKGIEEGNAFKTNVYDITVQDCHEYYANGILVHNCDPSVLVKVGNIGKDLYLKKICYQKTPTSDLLFDLIERPLLEEEARRYIEANSEEWYEELCQLRVAVQEAAARMYPSAEERTMAIEDAKIKLIDFREGGVQIDKIIVVCDTQDVYKGRGAMVEQQFVSDLNRLSIMYGYYWNFVKVGAKPIVPGISLMKKFNLILIKDKDVEIEQQNYCYAKDSSGELTNMPDKDSSFNHFWDASRYVIWKMFKHLVTRFQ
jgi:hypothetical protein